MAKLKAKKEVLSHLKMHLVENSILGEATEEDRLENTENEGTGTRSTKGDPWLGQPCEKKHIFRGFFLYLSCRHLRERNIFSDRVAGRRRHPSGTGQTPGLNFQKINSGKSVRY